MFPGTRRGRMEVRRLALAGVQGQAVRLRAPPHGALPPADAGPRQVRGCRYGEPPPLHTFYSGSGDSLIVHGDNLHALKALLPRYAGRVKCVYIDPPYNTGNEGWTYNDNVNSPLMREWRERNDFVDREDLERHDKWLCMMWPRLQLLRELLSGDGVIFVSIDDNEHHHLRMLMDEIFGEENFFATLVRRAMHTVRNSSKDFNLNADYVLAYAKEKEWFGAERSRYIRQIIDRSANYQHDDGDGRGPYKLDPLHARNYYTPYEFVFGNGARWTAPEGSFPRYSEETLSEMEADGRIAFSNSEPRAKRYLAEVQEGRPPDAILDPGLVGFNAGGTRMLAQVFGTGGVFPQPKPVELVKFLIELLRDPDAIVLDSFAGSGTTAHAVLALNREDGGGRRFILVECEDYADTITAERVRRAIAGVPDARDEALREGLGGSFTFCTLGDPVTVEGMLSGETLPPFASLAAWLLHTATGVTAESSALSPPGEDGLFHEDGSYRCHLLYEPDLEWLRSEAAALNEERARRIGEAARGRGKRALVFAAAKYLGQRELDGYGVTFGQLPYELHRRG